MSIKKLSITAVVAISGATLVSCHADAPSNQLVMESWRHVLSESGCEANVAYSAPHVVGISVSGNTAEVIVGTRGHWIGPTTIGFGLPFPPLIAGPCAGFSAADHEERPVEGRLSFRRFDTGWRLDPVGEATVAGNPTTGTHRVTATVSIAAPGSGGSSGGDSTAPATDTLAPNSYETPMTAPARPNADDQTEGAPTDNSAQEELAARLRSDPWSDALPHFDNGFEIDFVSHERVSVRVSTSGDPARALQLAREWLAAHGAPMGRLTITTESRSY
jgi:hypothetical protein